jgi:hypothetical protein
VKALWVALAWGAAAAGAAADGVWLTAERVDLLRRRVERGEAPNAGAFRAVEEAAEAALARDPAAPSTWYVPRRYADREGHYAAKDGLMRDANGAYAQALRYRIRGEARFAAGAARVIDAWAAGVQKMEVRDDSRLSFTYHFPAMLFAADLLAPATAEWPEERRERFRRFVKERALPMNTMERDNNWGNWGVLLVASASAYLGDRAGLEAAALRWKRLVELQVGPDGHLHHEVKRNDGAGDFGMWYTHFSIMPAALGAEVLRVNGIDLFDYAAPGGASLKSAFGVISGWSRDPRRFPYFKGEVSAMFEPLYCSYFEILNARWPNPDAAAVLAAGRPWTAIHSAPWLTFTHGEP